MACLPDGLQCLDVDAGDFRGRPGRRKVRIETPRRDPIGDAARCIRRARALRRSRGSKAGTARIILLDGRRPFSKECQIMRKSILLAASAAIVLTAVPALAGPAVCIRQDDLYNWTALNDKQVVIENFRHQKALLTLIGTCSGLKFHET